jgi:TonB family protein
MREADNVVAFARQPKAGRSMRRRYLGKMLVAAVCALGGWLPAGMAQGAKPKAVAVPDTAKGFDKQYKQFFKDYRKAKKEEREAVLDQFAIPLHWFTDTFGPGEGAGVANEYAKEFEIFKSHTVGRITGECCPDTKLTGTEQMNVGHVNFPEVDRFEIQMTVITMQTDSQPAGFGLPTMWMDGFIYVDGAFRFYGRGNGSFFAAPLIPLRDRLYDPCSKNHVQLGGKLIHRVEPVYPEQAKAQHVGGRVDTLVTVELDGSVKEVQVLNGSELLEEATKQAIMQWKYEPFIKCGKPVEMKIPERVEFPAPSKP